MRYSTFPILFVVLSLVVFPWSVRAAVSGSTYTIDPENAYDSTHHSVSSTNYSLDGSLDPITARTTSTSYILESGDAFQWYCGDGFIDPNESCDGNDNLGGATCVSQGYASGTLACSSSCAYSVSSCVAASGGGGGGGAPAVSADEVPEAPSVDSSVVSDFSYRSSLLLNGSMDSATDELEVNQSTTGVTFPSSTTWNVTVSLSYGLNTFSLVASNDEGDSDETIFDLYRRLVGDVNEDDTVNDYDLSKFIALWGGSSRAGDFNEDTSVDDYDFSMLVSRWGTSV